jgi:outer membrane murein-binding lipoprotein Lpp
MIGGLVSSQAKTWGKWILLIVVLVALGVLAGWWFFGRDKGPGDMAAIQAAVNAQVESQVKGRLAKIEALESDLQALRCELQAVRLEVETSIMEREANHDQITGTDTIDGVDHVLGTTSKRPGSGTK